MRKKKASQTDRPQPGFEATIERLEQIVQELEGRQTGLDESLARYEEGVELLKRATEILSKAERRIAVLEGVDEAGRAIEHPIDEQRFASDLTAPGRSPRSAEGASPTAPPAGRKESDAPFD